MAGTGEAVAADDDALFVLTAVLLTPAKFPSVLGDDYPEACGALGLTPVADGYGLVLGQDVDGARWTVVVDDVSLVAVAIASWDCGMEYDLSPDDRTVVVALPGWPLAVAVAAPGVPAPHDPEPDEDDDSGVRVLTPPDTSTWGPAQRRLGADEIALQWATWRAQIDDSEFENVESDSESVEPGVVASQTPDSEPGAEAQADAEPDAEPGPDTEADAEAAAEAPHTVGTASEDKERAGAGPDAGSEAEDADGTEGVEGPEGADGAAEQARSVGAETAQRVSGVRRVLEEARGYVDAPPPLGRVRSAFATQEARTLRADGPGWSLVARTDDIAFVLLDEEPGEVLPVGRGPELPALLEALDKMAVRPA
ncbi:hypothetical protein RCO28_14950 [Streptomyces sp. LHD-70]|uniref:hypothetical protein n=1 Tax=Streptomyces sp. LHD-70 TaxID=3072140 RepID=UPI00280F5B5B|nr:hypothetical protein [Streptomyces sp. LHD-70]MDQ8703779.1 hypothetical protein [Streptomyces sp. LHD-70]